MGYQFENLWLLWMAKWWCCGQRDSFIAGLNQLTFLEFFHTLERRALTEYKTVKMQ